MSAVRLASPPRSSLVSHTTLLVASAAHTMCPRAHPPCFPRLNSLFGAGGRDGTATFIRSITFLRGTNKVTASLVNIGKDWVLQGE